MSVVESVSTARESLKPPIQTTASTAFTRTNTDRGNVRALRHRADDTAETGIDPVLSADERFRLICVLATFRRPIEGRDAVSSRTAQLALSLQEQAAKEGSWLSPHVSRSPHGEVVFEWWHGARKLTVYVGEHAREFVRVWGPDIYTEMADGVLTGGYDLAQHLRWLRAGL